MVDKIQNLSFNHEKFIFSDDKYVQEMLEKCLETINGYAREGQKEMLLLVNKSLRTQKPLLVEAGTGTGKSLAYLVPIYNVGYKNKKIVISTATLALQNQIYNKDIPIVHKVYEANKNSALKVEILKGWSNYLCIHKLNGGFIDDTSMLYDQEELFKINIFEKINNDNDEKENFVDQKNVENSENNTHSNKNMKNSQLGEEIVQIRQWAKKTKTGDKDELKIPISSKAWDMVSINPTQCLSEKCPFYSKCFPKTAREKADEADVIITNHSILGIETVGKTQILPDYDILVVDEAHELEKRVISQATVTINAGKFKNLLQKLLAISIVDEKLENEIENFNELLPTIQQGWMKRGLSDEIYQVLEKIKRCLSNISNKVYAVEKDNNKNIKMVEKINTVKLFLQDINVALENLLGFNEYSVIWATKSDDNSDKNININMAPLNVSKKIYEILLKDKTSIFTSATLTFRKSFKKIVNTLGLNNYCDVAHVNSPFDYRKQGILYMCADLPSPAGNGNISTQSLLRLKELLESSSGGALCLFSSTKNAQLACEYIRDNTDLEIFLQGEGHLPNLINNFKENINSCLFGTLSLWQGVDVAGQSLRLLVIDRIPFARPNDPFYEAYCDIASKNNENPFMSVALPQASLLLAQGAGRLIRTTEDKGVVAILDSRIINSKYGSILRDCLPDFWQTNNLKMVENSLRNLSFKNN